MSGVSRPHLFFAVSRLFFTLLRDWSYATFSLYPHGSESILLGFGAVMMLGWRQSGETIFSAFPEPILNADMLIVTFKFQGVLNAYKIPLYFTTEEFEVLHLIF